MRRPWYLTPLGVGLLLSIGCSGPGTHCWNEYEGETWNSRGRVVRTCCQPHAGGFPPYDNLTGPVTCTTMKQIDDAS